MTEEQNVATVAETPGSLLPAVVDPNARPLSCLGREVNRAGNNTDHARRARISSYVNSWMENIEVLLPCLEKIATIHPAAEGLHPARLMRFTPATHETPLIAVVAAFSVLFKLESTRRENDNRIKALYKEIKFTMAMFER